MGSYQIVLQFSIPRMIILSNQVDFRDCYKLDIFYTLALDVSVTNFIKNPYANSIQSALERICTKTCGQAGTIFKKSFYC